MKMNICECASVYNTPFQGLLQLGLVSIKERVGSEFWHRDEVQTLVRFGGGEWVGGYTLLYHPSFRLTIF